MYLFSYLAVLQYTQNTQKHTMPTGKKKYTSAAKCFISINYTLLGEFGC